MFLLAVMNPYVEIVLNNLIQIIGSVLLIAAIPLVTLVVGLWQKKTGIAISADNEQLLSQAVTNGISHAETWASMQTTVAGTPPAGALKLENAIAFVKSEITRLGLVQLAEDKITALIHAQLGTAQVTASATVQTTVPTTSVAPAIPPVTVK